MMHRNSPFWAQKIEKKNWGGGSPSPIPPKNSSNSCKSHDPPWPR